MDIIQPKGQERSQKGDEIRKGTSHKRWGEEVMMKQFRLRSLQPYLGWVHFHHFNLFNNSQIFCDLCNIQLASSLHFNVTISSKCCVYELCFHRFAGTVCQQTCHHAPPCPCTLKWHNFKQNTAKKKKKKKTPEGTASINSNGGGHQLAECECLVQDGAHHIGDCYELRGWFKSQIPGCLM